MTCDFLIIIYKAIAFTFPPQTIFQIIFRLHEIINDKLDVIINVLHANLMKTIQIFDILRICMYCIQKLTKENIFAVGRNSNNNI